MKSVSILNPRSVLRFHDLPGQGTPLVFLHGLGCASSCDYPRIARDQALLRRRCLLIDFLGSGFSDRPRDFDYTVQAHARITVDVVNALGLGSIDLYGHSMGGSVAIEVSGLLSSRVRNLVLAEPNLHPGGGVFSRAIAAQTEAEYVARGHLETVGEASLAENHIWAGSLAITEPVAAHRGAVSLVRGTSPSWHQKLCEVSARSTVLFGALSLPDPDFDRLVQDGIAVSVVPDAGHSMAWENPAGLAMAISNACS